MKHAIIIAFFGAAILLSGRSLAQSNMAPDNATDTTMLKPDSTLPKAEFGIKAGANFQNLNGDSWKQGYTPGIFGGIVAGLHKNKIGLRVEVLIGSSTHTTTLADSMGNTAKISTLHIDVPLLFEYSFARILSLQVGPQYTNIVSATSNSGLVSGDPKVVFKSSSLSAVVGLEVKLPQQFLVGARYVYGFTNINNGALTPTSEKWQTTSFQIYLGYTFQ